MDTENKLDKYDYHEILDRAYVAMDHFNEFVGNHQTTMQNPELKKLAEEVSGKMYSFYNLCASYSLKFDNGELD